MYNTHQLVDVQADPRAACHAANGRCWQLMRASAAKNALLSGFFPADMLRKQGVQCAQVGETICDGFSCGAHYFTNTQTKKAAQRGIRLTTPAQYHSLSNTEMFLHQEDKGWHVGRLLSLALPQGDTDTRKSGNCVRIPVEMPPHFEQTFSVGASVEQLQVAGASGTLMTELVAGVVAVYVLIPYGPTKFKERILKPVAPARSISPTPHVDLGPQYE